MNKIKKLIGDAYNASLKIITMIENVFTASN